MNKIILFLASTVAVFLLHSGWVGLNNGNWSNSSNWIPPVVPNGLNAVADISKISGVNGNVNLDIDPTINQLNFSSPSTAWNITGSPHILTFNGTKAKIAGSPLFSGAGGYGGAG